MIKRIIHGDAKATERQRTVILKMCADKGLRLRTVMHTVLGQDAKKINRYGASMIIKYLINYRTQVLS